MIKFREITSSMLTAIAAFLFLAGSWSIAQNAAADEKIVPSCNSEACPNSNGVYPPDCGTVSSCKPCDCDQVPVYPAGPEPEYVCGCTY